MKRGRAAGAGSYMPPGNAHPDPTQVAAPPDVGADGVDVEPGEPAPPRPAADVVRPTLPRARVTPTAPGVRPMPGARSKADEDDPPVPAVAGPALPEGPVATGSDGVVPGGATSNAA